MEKPESVKCARNSPRQTKEGGCMTNEEILKLAKECFLPPRKHVGELTAITPDRLLSFATELRAQVRRATLEEVLERWYNTEGDLAGFYDWLCNSMTGEQHE